MPNLMFLLISTFFLFVTSPGYTEENVVKINDLEIWTETFGECNNPAVLLIHGAGTSGIFWPNKFCEKLKDRGFFVIRYDHRDIGKSSVVDYQKNPYGLQDLAKDSLLILDFYGIEKAHVVGLSMGGLIGQILAIQHPKRLHSLVSMMSSPNHSNILAVISGKQVDPHALPPPPQELVNTWEKMKTASINTKNERISLNLSNWKICAGPIGYNEEEFKDLEELAFERTKSFEAVFNHWFAMASWPNRMLELRGVSTPTLIIHGDSDVLFPIEHGIATADAIPGAKLVIVPGLGHALCDFFVEEIASKILSHLSSCNELLKNEVSFAKTISTED